VKQIRATTSQQNRGAPSDRGRRECSIISIPHEIDLEVLGILIHPLGAKHISGPQKKSCVLLTCTCSASSLSKGSGPLCPASWADADLNAHCNPCSHCCQKKRKLLSMCTVQVQSEVIFNAHNNGRISGESGRGYQQRETGANRTLTCTFHASSLHRR